MAKKKTAKKTNKKTTKKKAANKKKAAKKSTAPKKTAKKSSAKKATKQATAKKASTKKTPQDKAKPSKSAAKKSAPAKADFSQPRRFELIDGMSEKFWTIQLQGESHTAQYGRIGSLGQSTTKEFDDADAALASYQKLVEEKVGKGYVEVFPPTAAELRRRQKEHEPFWKSILADPDDPVNYGVYADWLTERGDPRGEFIHLQLQLEDERLKPAERKELRKREKQMLSRHEEEWLGSYAPLLMNNPTVSDGEDYGEVGPNYKYGFQRGFLASLRIRRLFVPMSRTIRDAPETRFLRELVIESVESAPYEESGHYEFEKFEPGDDVPTWEKDRVQFITAHPLAGTREFTSLHTFQVGMVCEEDIIGKAMPPGYRPGFCHCYCNPAAAIVEKMPNLRQLHLLCKDFDLAGIFKNKKLKRLESLRIYHLGNQGADRQERKQYEFPLTLLAANKSFANLQELAFHPHGEEYHIGYPEHASFLPLEQVKSVLYAKHLTKLTGLQLRLSNMGDEGCREIVKSGILKRLKWLDLRHGCITDEGAKILADCPDLQNLEFLDLARNGLTDVGVKALRKAKVRFEAGNQQSPAELAAEEYLNDGDFE